MKTYDKMVHSGNMHEWHSPKKVGQTTIHESHADELNSQFQNTGVKYVAAAKDDGELTERKQAQGLNDHGHSIPLQDAADHGEPNLEVKDGKVKPVDKTVAQGKGPADSIDAVTTKPLAKKRPSRAKVKK